jgi:hypothetical protein
MAGRYLRGALVEFAPTFLGSAPNVIVFQFNPETMTHSWTQPEAAAPPGGDVVPNPLAVTGVPGESFSFTLALDANDMIADGGPAAALLAQTSGVYTRLAALEMLQYPVAGSDSSSLLGTLTAGAGAAVGAEIGGASGTSRPVPMSQVPTVIFVWGPGRIVPVRVTSLSTTEKLFDAALNPTQAEVTIELRVLTPKELEFVTGPLAGVAKAAYEYSKDLRQALALANLGVSAEDIIGLLPV